MAKLEEVTADIREKLKKGKPIQIRLYAINDFSDRILETMVRDLLHHYDKEQYTTTIYTITKDLVINGVKANQKRMFFEDKGLDIADDADYEAGIQSFNEKLHTPKVKAYEEKARQKNQYVLVYVEHSANGLLLKVSNTSPLLPFEEKRIRENLEKAHHYRDIVEFHLEHSDNSEGEGIGLALAIVLLKSDGFDPQYFRLFTGDGVTTARVEIPFTRNYEYSRPDQTHYDKASP